MTLSNHRFIPVDCPPQRQFCRLAHKSQRRRPLLPRRGKAAASIVNTPTPESIGYGQLLDGAGRRNGQHSRGDLRCGGQPDRARPGRVETPDGAGTCRARWSSTSSRNWQLACQCIRQALAARRADGAADIQSVACCSMREGIVLYDRNGDADLGLRQRRCPRQPRSERAQRDPRPRRLNPKCINVLRPDAGAERHAAPAVAGAPSSGYLPPGRDHDHDQRLAGQQALRRAGGRSLQRRHHRHAGSLHPRLAPGAARHGRAARRYSVAGERDRQRAGARHRTGGAGERAAAQAPRW